MFESCKWFTKSYKYFINISCFYVLSKFVTHNCWKYSKADDRNLRKEFKRIFRVEYQVFSAFCELLASENLKKGYFYNGFHQVCEYLGLVMKGVFWKYFRDGKTADDSFSKPIIN